MPHGQTDTLTETNEEGVDFTPPVLRQPRLQSVSCLLRVLGLVPAPEVCDSVDVHIHADALGAVPGHRQAEICHLGADARERCESLDRIGDIAIPSVA